MVVSCSRRLARCSALARSFCAYSTRTVLGFRSRSRFSAFVAMGIPALLLCLATGPRTAAAATKDCVDVRTGRPFSIPAQRFAADGAVIPDLGLFDQLCVGAVSATYAVPLTDGAGGQTRAILVRASLIGYAMPMPTLPIV